MSYDRNTDRHTSFRGVQVRSNISKFRGRVNSLSAIHQASHLHLLDLALRASTAVLKALSSHTGSSHWRLHGLPNGCEGLSEVTEFRTPSRNQRQGAETEGNVFSDSPVRSQPGHRALRLAVVNCRNRQAISSVIFEVSCVSPA